MNQTFRKVAQAAPIALMLTVLASCDDDNKPTPTPTVTPTPSPSAAASLSVANCINQAIPGTGLTVAQAVIPDTIKVNLNAASGFPNGRRLPDPVIDVTLAVIFLDLTKHSPATLASLPLNPPANDLPFRTTFPYLAAAQGNPPLADTSGTTFDFRTDPDSAFVRVDRMGMPAVATALIGTSLKNTYNDVNPEDDAAGQFVPEITAQLTGLHTALADDFQRAGLTSCARNQ
jgi:hypothetical protein